MKLLFWARVFLTSSGVGMMLVMCDPIRYNGVFTCSASAGQQLLRIVVLVVTKLNYLRFVVFLVPPMSFLLLLGN